MLKIEQLQDTYRAAAATPIFEPGDHDAGLRAVEAAVRADQIERDAAIAEGHHESVGGLIASSTLDLPYIVARTIRAQLPAIVSEPSTPEQPEGGNR